eukprot:4209155-Heterocapsa_arctica.AAC.1
MKDGINPPEDGSWPPALIHSLMTAIGGQRMRDQLTAPAHRLSESMSKNIVDGDSAFLHWPKCIGKPSHAANRDDKRNDGSRQATPPDPANKEPLPDALLDAFAKA